MNRGSSSIRSSMAPGAPSFNEAPIHESGKYYGAWERIAVSGQLQ